MARAEREAERLNTPGRRRRSTIPTIKVDRDAFGKFAEAFARFMGTARFLFGMTVVIVLWLLWNVPWGPPRPRFDEFPFIFLTLVLSLQASYAAPLILLAQNRQEQRDRAPHRSVVALENPQHLMKSSLLVGCRSEGLTDFEKGRQPAKFASAAARGCFS